MAAVETRAMRRLGGLWPQVVSFENLLLAYRRARRGKGRSGQVAAFALDLEHELLGLQRALESGEYRPGGYRLFTIYERKPRLIAAAPFRDRVVHHAVMNVIEPALDRTFIHDSYACRKGKGVHAAVDRYQGWARGYVYALKMDVQQYFASIDHALLKEKLARRIKDTRVLDLLARIIDTGPEAVGGETVYFPGTTCSRPSNVAPAFPSATSPASSLPTCTWTTWTAKSRRCCGSAHTSVTSTTWWPWTTTRGACGRCAKPWRSTSLATG